MVAPLADRLMDRVAHAAVLYHRLVLLVGPRRSGKTCTLGDMAASKSWPRINVNLALSEKLLELTRKQRVVRLPGLLSELVDAAASEIVVLDNVELLFATELETNPLALLQNEARNRTIVVAWPGAHDGRTLTYAEPGHPEYRSYPMPDAQILTTDMENTAYGTTAPQEIS